MRWDALFADMEAQFDAEFRLGLESEIAERARIELASICLADRLRAALGDSLGLELGSGLQIRGALVHVGSEWIVLDEATHQWLVPLRSVVAYEGLGRFAVAGQPTVRQKLGLASALRGLARDRSDLSVHLETGTTQDRVLTGVIDRVGQDHFDLALTLPGEPRRAGSVAGVTTVPFARLSALRSTRTRGF